MVVKNMIWQLKKWSIEHEQLNSAVNVIDSRFTTGVIKHKE